MDKRERLRLGLVIDIVHDWVVRYNAVTNERDAVKDAAQAAARTLLKRIVEVPADGAGDATFAVLPLEPADEKHLQTLARYVRLPVMSDDDVEALHQLPEEMPAALRDARKAVEGGGMFGRKPLTDEVREAADFVLEYGVWGRAEGLDALIDRLKPEPLETVEISLDEALSPGVGLAAILARRGTPELLTSTDALATLAQHVTPTTTAVVVCSPEGRKAADLLAQG